MKTKFILDTRELLHMPLLTTFNFLVEGFPEALSTEVIHALFKGGDASRFDNYRGIMVGPILKKLFVMILDKRLSKWVEQQTWVACQGSSWVSQILPHYWPTFHIADFDGTEQGKKEATILLLCGCQKGVQYCVAWSVMACVGWPWGGGTFLTMLVSDVCQGYCMHQPPKWGCHL